MEFKLPYFVQDGELFPCRRVSEAQAENPTTVGILKLRIVEGSLQFFAYCERENRMKWHRVEED